MYFPFFRGKQFELSLIKDLHHILNETSEKIVPVIEPVRKKLNTLAAAITLLGNNNISYVLITNPTVGELITKPSDGGFDFLKEKQLLDSLEKSDSHYYGYIITGDTTENDIDEFFTQFTSERKCLIHYHSFLNREHLTKKIDGSGDCISIFLEDKTSRGYRNNFKKWNRVITRDGFETKDRNADYPDDDYFTDLHEIYKTEFYGFGDFLTIGDNYKETGGPAYVVVIHITYLNSDGDIYVKHFKSESSATYDDPAGKFYEAVTKLYDFVSSNPDIILETKALKEFLELYNTNHYPGLGYVKKLSMQHHIELMASII